MGYKRVLWLKLKLRVSRFQRDLNTSGARGFPHKFGGISIFLRFFLFFLYIEQCSPPSHLYNSLNFILWSLGYIMIKLHHVLAVFCINWARFSFFCGIFGDLLLSLAILIVRVLLIFFKIQIFDEQAKINSLCPKNEPTEKQAQSDKNQTQQGVVQKLRQNGLQRPF